LEQKSLIIQVNRSPILDSRSLATFESGVDELNLAEFPLAGISDRTSDGKKTVVFEDQIFDRNEGREVTRRLTISGSDRYGLPTAIDDDVLLACIQISKLQDFQSPEVTFSRYEILKLLRWEDDTRNYYRIAKALRRWKGLTIYSDRAFYDHGEKSWVNRDFGIIDTLYIYQREATQKVESPSASRLTWNEVIFRSFKAGYLKQLDWGLYTRLESPVAKRLYRFLDKRFYHGSTVEIDLQELALRKVRLSDSNNVAQLKRALRKGIEELESVWDLKRLPDDKRFEKKGKGNWLVRFERKPKRKAMEIPQEIQNAISAPVDPTRLELALTKRGVGPASAEELSMKYSLDTVQMMIELFDWYNQRGQTRDIGFLVHSIKNSDRINFPKGFESTIQVSARKDSEKNRIASERDFQTQRERSVRVREEKRIEAFTAFWRSLSKQQQYEFEIEAIDATEPTKREGYLRSQGKGSQLFEHYRTVILRDHYERTKELNEKMIELN